MGTSILRGITAGLVVTVLTLLAVLGTTIAKIDQNMITILVDFGLLLSCLTAGYRASRSSGKILAAGLASGGYAVVGVLLLALYFPIDSLGAVKIISQGTGLGLLAGLLGAGTLRSGPDPIERAEEMVFAKPYTRREHFHERKNIYEVLGKEEDPQLAWETKGIKDQPEAERARIYELCDLRSQEKEEEEEAFSWWQAQGKKQYRSR